MAEHKYAFQWKTDPGINAAIAIAMADAELRGQRITSGTILNGLNAQGYKVVRDESPVHEDEKCWACNGSGATCIECGEPGCEDALACGECDGSGRRPLGTNERENGDSDETWPPLQSTYHDPRVDCPGCRRLGYDFEKMQQVHQRRPCP